MLVHQRVPSLPGARVGPGTYQEDDCILQRTRPDRKVCLHPGDFPEEWPDVGRWCSVDLHEFTTPLVFQKLWLAILYWRGSPEYGWIFMMGKPWKNHGKPSINNYKWKKFHRWSGDNLTFCLCFLVCLTTGQPEWTPSLRPFLPWD